MEISKVQNINHAKTEKIIGCALNVINTLGNGFLEKVYENALIVEFTEKNIPYYQQKIFDVYYKNKKVGVYIPDIIAYDDIIVEIKTIDHITNTEIGQVVNYLKVTGFQTSLIINFKNQKLEWKRVIL